eukprot:TRINITY_DN9030_c0_g1_i5.p3 TRINITY_DN9030_c0_g1~~TRINITY_DN9030_c0_g1_i5.p3  ORF type:complete len:178 (+),score=27.88 TRINITY_DN9030_c0_g1_i5:1225-1758(+)
MFQASSRTALSCPHPPCSSVCHPRLQPGKHGIPVVQASMSWDVHLAAACSLDTSRIFWNVYQARLSQPTMLQDSTCYDVAASVGCFDMQDQGHNTLVLGTYGRCLLGYRLEHLLPTMAAAWAEDGVHLFDLSHLERTDLRRMPGPVYGIAQADMTGDGVTNMLVQTHNGLHVLEAAD